MKYITSDDLLEVIQNNLLQESVQLDTSIIDKIELKVIDFAKSYISGRYNIDLIFSEPTPMRSPLLAQAIAMIVVYRSVRRNAARKVPEDFPDMYKEAVRMLENIQKGSQILIGMPTITADAGKSGGIRYGNNTNPDNFI
jgi:phage gp36-like protein